MHVGDTLSEPGIHLQAPLQRGCLISLTEGSKNDRNVLRCEGGRGSWFGCQTYPIELTFQIEYQLAPFRKTWDRRLHIQTTHNPIPKSLM